jgi:RNA polymerase-binding transcription factor DksA
LGDTVQLEPIRTRLIARRDELATRAALAAADLRRENEPLSADEVLQGISDAARSELAGIDRALRRIESGDYFKCARCGGAIEASRLEAVPHTDRCASCAREAR